MIKYSQIGFLAVAASFSLATASYGQIIRTWTPGAGAVEDFNNEDNWSGGYIPEYTFDESGLIGVGGIAYLEDQLLNSNGEGPAGLIVHENSTLDIRTTGALEVAGPTYFHFGTLRIQGAGTLHSESLRLRNATFRYSITEESDIASAPVTVTHGVDFAATVALDLNGLESFPVGQTIQLIEAESFNTNFTPQIINAPAPGTGYTYRLKETPADGRISLGVALEQSLVLTVDRQSGEVFMNNPVGTPLDFDGIRITSASGSLDQTQASAISGNYAVAGSPQQVSQLRTTAGTDTVTNNQFSLGAIYDPVASSLGSPFPQDLLFSYTTNGVDEVYGVVEYINDPASFNNVVLEVDGSTGLVTIRNDSAFDLSIEGYTITSAAGLLDATEGPSAWNSLELQGVDGGAWDSSPASDATRLTELITSGVSPLLAGQSHVLGEIYDVANGSEEDLAVTLLLAGGDGGNVVNGIVNFVSGVMGLGGDFNNDGVVDAADYTVWRNNLGAANEDALGGNGNGVGGVDQDDYLLWKQNFGETAPSALALSTGNSAVPEPSTAILAALAGVVGLALWRRS